MRIGETRIVFDTRDAGMIHTLSSRSEYEPDVSRALRTYLRPEDCLIDVGANVGIHAATFNRRRSRDGRILALEPNRSLFRILEDNIALNGSQEGVELLQAAAFDREGTMPFSYESWRHRIGALEIEDAQNFGDVRYDVPVVRLDGFLDFVGGRRAVIKVDVEGREAGVLAGAPELLGRRDTVVVMEFRRSVMESVGTDVPAFFEGLAEAGFGIWRAHHKGMIPTDPPALLTGDLHMNLVLARNAPDEGGLPEAEPR